jgi:hypothetical protein
MTQPLTIIIVEKNSDLRILNVKDYKEEELYKKCGFKKGEDFLKQTEWSAKIDGQKYYVSMFAKTDGKANTENKYDFPPPIDTKLYFGSCALVCHIKNTSGNKVFTNLSLELWTKIYEKLFGGFEDLKTTIAEDEEEDDELAKVPSKMKTKKGGYLKDGFVVDDDETDEDDEYDDSDDDDDEGDTEENEINNDDEENDLILEVVGSELSEETYDYSDDEN